MFIITRISRQISQVRPNTSEAVLRKWAKCTESLGQPKYQFLLTQDWVSVNLARMQHGMHFDAAACIICFLVLPARARLRNLSRRI